ncbi:MAG: flavin reductase family protein [Thermoplasmata archaeon]|nr:flavin reductase family protein [Thermoplasmata archaeon]
MGRWPTGVAVVTSRDASGDVGMTVNALLSVTLDPPRVLISLTEGADTTPVVRRSGIFAANFLSAAQRPVSERFAKAIPPPEKFAGLAVHRGLTGAPLIDGGLGYVECRVRSATLAGDHVLFLADVVGLGLGGDALPLVFYHSTYADPQGEHGLSLPPSHP